MDNFLLSLTVILSGNYLEHLPVKSPAEYQDLILQFMVGLCTFSLVKPRRENMNIRLTTPTLMARMIPLERLLGNYLLLLPQLVAPYTDGHSLNSAGHQKSSL
jgi:hypothetical protein